MTAIAHISFSFPGNGFYFLLLCAVLYLYHSGAFSKNLPLPPGPRARFLDCIFGVKYQIPTSVPPWKVYAQWAHTYGGTILSLKFGHYNKFADHYRRISPIVSYIQSSNPHPQ